MGDIAGLTGRSARDLSEVLRFGGQLSRALPQEKAERLARTLTLLGLETEIRPVSSFATPPQQIREPLPAQNSRPGTGKPPAKLLILAVLIMLTISLASVLQSRATQTPAPGMLVPEPPVQLDAGEVRPWLYKDHLVTPKARYSLEARVLAAKRYRFGRGGRLAPVDVALGWGPMSDSNLLKELKIAQRNRWYFVSWSSLPVPRQTVFHNSANTHLIPADAAVAKQIKRLRKHDVVEMTGYLVDISATDGFYWRSSLSRLDTGNGGCELFWVEHISIGR